MKYGFGLCMLVTFMGSFVLGAYVSSTQARQNYYVLKKSEWECESQDVRASKRYRCNGYHIMDGVK
jgi:hypothetical protein